jgi:hypothetical protein
MVYQALHQPPRLLGGQTVPVRCACNVEGQQLPFSAICRSSCSRWDSEKASSIDLPSCGRNASTNTVRLADRRAVGDLACDDARVAVAYNDGFAQVAFL